MQDKDLKSFLDYDKISLQELREIVETMERKEKLEKYKIKIWLDKNGYYNAVVPRKDGPGTTRLRRRRREDVESGIIECIEKVIENPTIGELFERWRKHQQEYDLISESTITRYSYVFKRHFSTVGFDRKRIKEIDPLELTEFLEKQLAEYKMTAKAFSSLKHILAGVLWQAGREGLITWTAHDVFSRLFISKRSFRVPHKEDCEEVFSDDEMKKILEYLVQNQDIWNLGILLIFVSGMRVGELVALKPGDFTDKTITINKSETRFYDPAKKKYVYKVKDSPKTAAGYRTIVIPKQWEWIIQKLLEMSAHREYVFMRNGKRMQATSIRFRVYRICQKVLGYRRSPHKIRKTYASILLDMGIDKRTVMDQMGHVDISISEIFYHRNRKTIERKQEMISAIPDFDIVTDQCTMVTQR